MITTAEVEPDDKERVQGSSAGTARGANGKQNRPERDGWAPGKKNGAEINTVKSGK
jgi:hypothetical protein